MQWGRWFLEAQSTRKVLVFYDDDNRELTYVDLAECTNGFELCDWVCHLSGKNYISPEDLGNLVFAIRDLFGPLGSWPHMSKDKHAKFKVA